MVPPSWKLKVRLLALDESATPTTRDTGIFSGVLVAPAETTVIRPLYVPGARPPPLASTLRLAGVVAPEGVTESQDPPEVVLALAVKLTAPPELVMATLIGAGAVPPLVCVKASENGDAAMVAAGATRKVTAMVCGLLVGPAAATVMEPV